ncbi:unnamed protein product [Medioppia subpectinata]|uniref:UDENN domain-containing protein n=1 Tax=Medioppia subpectinata TaxID=1979941 RepID=A0A7R9PUK3_9ACAR|nr:unnamed protein product [Medioppia subpectinata]CAG2101668.1 unnamed protein product [Medioppia subpectinata]
MNVYCYCCCVLCLTYDTNREDIWTPVMGSRIRTNTDISHVFECYLEIGWSEGGVATAADNKPSIVAKYPADYCAQEILKCVPQFAYPCELAVETVTHFSFVLTNMDSKWTFGFCRLAPYSRTCLAIVSYLPWHSTFYKILNHCSDIAANAGEHTSAAQSAYKRNFLDAIYGSEIPQPGLELAVTYYADNGCREFVAQCPDHLKLPSIPEDRNLTEYFNAIDAHNMIVIFANMLNERRIIMTSKKLSRLSACVQAANALIYPMHWQHIFIPVLPHHLLDYLSAPMPFLIGVPTALMARVRRAELGDIVILDCDHNRVDSPFDDVQMLPTDIVHTLRKSLRNPMSVSMLGDLVARSFLRALVSLIGCYRDALRFTPGQKISFNYEAFVSARSPSVQTFLEKMLQLQIFRQFIEGRLEMLNNGEGFSDEFEFELNMYEDKSTHRLKTQYKEWLAAMRKEGGAILKSVNPRVKSVYRQVKDRSRQTYRDLKTKMQNNNDKSYHYSDNTQHKTSGTSADGYKAHKTASAPSSPTLPIRAIAGSIKKSISGNVIGKTDKTVTYVRQRASNNGSESNGKAITRLQNGFTKSLSVTNGLSSSSTASGSTLSGRSTAPEASPEISDVDSELSHEMLTFDRIEIDLMGELKEFLHKKSSTDESSNSSKSNKSVYSQNSASANSSSSQSNAISFIARPIPPPRSQTQRKAKPFGGDDARDGKEESLIELDTPPDGDHNEDAAVIFDPLLEPSRPTPRPANSFEFISGLPTVSAQTSAAATAGLPRNNSASSALSSLTNAKQNAFSLSDMINWSSSQITSVGPQKPNLMPTLPAQTTLSTASNPSNSTTTAGNPFKTSNSWQHFD